MAIASVPASEMLLEIIGHLGAAKMQTLPSDDQIIAEHIRSAYDLALMLHRADRRHVHVAIGNGSDTCKACGRDLRDEIHVRLTKAT